MNSTNKILKLLFTIYIDKTVHRTGHIVVCVMCYLRDIWCMLRFCFVICFRNSICYDSGGIWWLMVAAMLPLYEFDLGDITLVKNLNPKSVIFQQCNFYSTLIFIFLEPANRCLGMA